MKNAIRLLLCTCSLLLVVDAGIVSNRDGEETIVQAGSSGNASPQPSPVGQSQSEKNGDSAKPPTENIAQLPVEDTHDKLEYQHYVEIPADEIEVNVEVEPNTAPESQAEISFEIPAYEGVVTSSDSGYRLDAARNLYIPLQSSSTYQADQQHPYSIPSSYSFDSQPHLYRSLIGEIRYKLEAIARRQAYIVNFIQCSCSDAQKCRKPHLEKVGKQFPIPDFNPYNYFTQPFFGTSYYPDYLLTALNTLKSATEKITVRQNIIYQYAVCSCNKTNECSQKIKPVLDSLFGIDFDLLSPLFPYGSSLFNQLGLGSTTPEDLFGLGQELFPFNKPNITTFGNGSVSGSVYSGTIGESSRPSGSYIGTYVSSSSSDKYPSSGTASEVHTSCVGNAPCETSGSVSYSVDGNKPEVINLPLSKPNATVAIHDTPLSSLTHAIEELGIVASNISTNVGGSKPENSAYSPAASSLVASLSQTTHLANELLNKLSSGLLGKQPSKP